MTRVEMSVSASKHMLRREKELACAYDNLTDYDVSILVQYCLEAEDDINAHLLLASLFSGRSIIDLLDPKVVINMAITPQYGTLYSTIIHPASGSTAAHQPRNESPFIFLPSFLLKSIQIARNFPTHEVVDGANGHLSHLSKTKTSRLTATRVRRYLSKVAKYFKLSQAETCWISNTELEKHSGSSYLTMNSIDLADK